MSDFRENLQKAETFLARFRDAPLPHHIGGARLAPEGGEWFETRSPVDLKPLARVASGNAADIDRAAKAAKAAFPAWAAMDGHARKRLLHRVADAIEARAEEIALVECMDTGQAIRSWQARPCEAPRISASSPTARRKRATAGRCGRRVSSMLPRVSRSGRSA